MTKREDVVLKSGFFDKEWYYNKYKDVQLLNVDPLTNFIRYGHLLKRSPGPDFDSRFYLRSYSDVADGEKTALEHFMKAEDRDRRAVTEAQLAMQMQQLDASETAIWLGEGFVPPRSPIISYCIPIMGRLEDIQGTLRFNLTQNLRFRDKVEFLIVEFGAQQDVRDWVEQNFVDELSDGYLRIVTDHDTLETWHFGKAKNAFRTHLYGKIYTSLDGDNFVTEGETERLLGLHAAHPYGFVFHQFSGAWGDGTSGCVSLPAAIYRQVGYDPDLMPRQFDEMDLILGALAAFPAIPFIGILESNNAFTLSAYAREFAEKEKLPNRRIFIGDALNRVAPLNPRGADYTDKALHWRDMNNYNAAVSAYRRSKSPERKAEYLDRLALHKHRLAENLPADEVLKTLFKRVDLPEITPIDSASMVIVACVHDEEHFLGKFVAHHRAIGATHFLIVDDRSARPVNTLDLGPNVISVRPKVGDFRTSKTLWIECLIKAFVPEGVWVCTLDADEMLQVPDNFDDLGAVARYLEAGGHDFATCLLLDMLPDPQTQADQLEKAEEAYDTVFNMFCDMQLPPNTDYLAHRSTKWGFGSHIGLSWRVDARFHAFGTFDSLRKLSMFRYRVKRHLNQGFHSFHFIDKTPAPDSKIWQNDPIMPIFHYKLVRLFSDAMREKMLQIAGGYHARTMQNIQQIFGEGEGGAIASLSKLSPFLRPAADARLPGVFHLS